MKYGPQSVVIEKAARKAQMDTRALTSRGTAHDWHTVRNSLKAALPVLAVRWGLSS